MGNADSISFPSSDERGVGERLIKDANSWLRESKWDGSVRKRWSSAKKNALRRLSRFGGMENDGDGGVRLQGEVPGCMVFSGPVLKLGKVLKKWKCRYAILTTKCLALYEPQIVNDDEKGKESRRTFRTLMEIDVMTIQVELVNNTSDTNDEGDPAVFIVSGMGRRYKSIGKDLGHSNIRVQMKVLDALTRKRWVEMMTQTRDIAIKTAKHAASEIFRLAGKYPDSPRGSQTNAGSNEMKGPRGRSATSILLEASKGIVVEHDYNHDENDDVSCPGDASEKIADDNANEIDPSTRSDDRSTNVDLVEDDENELLPGSNRSSVTSPDRIRTPVVVTSSQTPEVEPSYSTFAKNNDDDKERIEMSEDDARFSSLRDRVPSTMTSDFDNQSVLTSSSSTFSTPTSSTSSSGFFYGKDNGSTSASSDRDNVMMSGTLMKLKKGGTDQWKSVQVKLRPNSLEYSYQKNMAIMMNWRVRHKIRLQDVEQVIENPSSPCQFTVDMLIGTPIPLRAANVEDARGWIGAIRLALRPHQELMAARNQELDAVNSSSLVTDDCETSTIPQSSEMTELGFMWKKSKHWKEWRIRRFRLEPTRGLLEYARPEDPEGLAQTEHWYVRGGRIVPVDVNYAVDLYCSNDRNGPRTTVLSVRCITDDDMVRNLLALRKAGMKLEGSLGVYTHLRSDYVDDVSVRIQHRLKKLSFEQVWPKDTSDAVARYLSLAVLPTVQNSATGSVNMRIDLSRNAALLQRRASCSPSVLPMGCMVMNNARRRIILNGFFLEAYAPEAHFVQTPPFQPIARYIVRGAAIYMDDVWKGSVKINCCKVDDRDDKKFDARFTLDVTAEMGTEQLWTFLHLVRKHGALIDDHCALVYSVVKKLRSDHDALMSVMEKVEALDRQRLAEKGDLWVPLASVVSKLELSSLMSNIAAEFKSRDYQRRYFEAATIHAGGRRETGNLRSGRFRRRNSIDSDAESVASGKSTDRLQNSDPRKSMRMSTRISSLSSLKSLEGDRSSMRVTSTSSLNTFEAHNVSGRIAIIVLGPSAAGKTHRTKANLGEVLRANSLPGDLSFVSIDGGIMRDTSKWWSRANALRAKDPRPIKGFTDLHKGYFQTHLRAFKKKVFSSLLKRGVNMVIPDTAAQVMSDRVGSYLKRLKQHKYTVVMTAVHASRESCNQNGKTREVEEGKKYSNFSWSYAMRSVERYFNQCRSIGYHKETFFIVDNTDWNNNTILMIPPRRGVQLDVISKGNDDVGIFRVKLLASVPFANDSTSTRTRRLSDVGMRGRSSSNQSARSFASEGSDRKRTSRPPTVPVDVTVKPSSDVPSVEPDAGLVRTSSWIDRASNILKRAKE